MSISAATHLATHGITLQQAHDFILANLADPATVFNAAKQFGVTNAMLGEIVGGYSAAQAQAFFDFHGLAGAQLDAGSTGATAGAEILPADFASLASLVSLSSYGGVLATSALRAQVITATNLADYNQTFDPAGYIGASDGVFTGAELGAPQLGSFAATAETLESLMFGSLINAFKALDYLEFQDLAVFTFLNQTALTNGEAAVVSLFIDLMVAAFQDSAAPAFLPDDAIAQFVVAAGTVLVELVGQGETPALLDGLVNGLLG